MKTSYDLSSLQEAPPHSSVVLLQAKWHSEFTDQMADACREVLLKGGVAKIEHVIVPGSYELPLIAKKLAKQGDYQAIVVFGALVKGETDHYQVILDTCIRELGKVMYDYEIPIIMELMPVHDIAHLRARSEGTGNKGYEAGLATLEMLSLIRQFS